MKTKAWYAERIIRDIRAGYTGRDLKIDEREVFLHMDSFINTAAKEGYLEKLQLGITNSVDDNLLTTYEWLTPTDPPNGSPSYVSIPTNYVGLPRNEGIVNVYFQNDFSAPKKKYFDPVLIIQYRDIAAYRNDMAQNNDGRISVAPKNGILYFNRGTIFATYGAIGLQLLVRDSSVIGDNDLYPIPAEREEEFIRMIVAWYRDRINKNPADLIKDSVDRP
jgi:hypothetical protein